MRMPYYFFITNKKRDFKKLKFFIENISKNITNPQIKLVHESTISYICELVIDHNEFIDLFSKIFVIDAHIYDDNLKIHWIKKS